MIPREYCFHVGFIRCCKPWEDQMKWVKSSADAHQHNSALPFESRKLRDDNKVTLPHGYQWENDQSVADLDFNSTTCCSKFYVLYHWVQHQSFHTKVDQPFSNTWSTTKTTITNRTCLQNPLLSCIKLSVFSPVLCLGHPAVHSHAFDRRALPALRSTQRQQEEVWPLLLFPVAATLVGAAGWADAVCRRHAYLCLVRRGVRMLRGMSLTHVPWLTAMAAGWRDRLGFDADAVIGETGASCPMDTRTVVEDYLSGGLEEMHHLVGRQWMLLLG